MEDRKGALRVGPMEDRKGGLRAGQKEVPMAGLTVAQRGDRKEVWPERRMGAWARPLR